MRATRSQAEFSELSAERTSETLTLKLEISKFFFLKKIIIIIIFFFGEKLQNTPFINFCKTTTFLER